MRNGRHIGRCYSLQLTYQIMSDQKMLNEKLPDQENQEVESQEQNMSHLLESNRNF